MVSRQSIQKCFKTSEKPALIGTNRLWFTNMCSIIHAITMLSTLFLYREGCVSTLFQGEPHNQQDFP